MWFIPIVLLLIVFLAIVLIRAALFRPSAAESSPAEPVFVNREKATRDLAEMIRCKTVSHIDPTLDDETEFDRFERLLPKLFPGVYSKCERESISDRSILLRWKGKSDKEPTVLMSHYDVVSAEDKDWEKPAFEGIIEDGVLWGRGTLDTKGNLNAILQAAESLIADGFVPKRDIYFAFGGNEEVNGNGSKLIVDFFRDKGIVPGMVLDEGGAVCEKIFPGVKKPIALIGTGEKGQLNIRYTVKGGGGHSSAPLGNNPIKSLCEACLNVEKAGFKYTLTEPTKEFFDTVGRYSGFLYRIIFGNQWCFSPVLSIFSKLSGGEFNALVRTTTAFTQMSGSKGANVIPADASMVSNHRIIPGETVESVIDHVKRAVNDDEVQISIINGTDPSAYSLTDCEAYDRIRCAASATFPDAIVSPYLMLACSDSRHWCAISDKVYRFSPMSLSKEERASIHGNNERIPLETISVAVEFYIRLIKNC